MCVILHSLVKDNLSYILQYYYVIISLNDAFRPGTCINFILCWMDSQHL